MKLETSPCSWSIQVEPRAKHSLHMDVLPGSKVHFILRRRHSGQSVSRSQHLRWCTPYLYNFWYPFASSFSLGLGDDQSWEHSCPRASRTPTSWIVSSLLVVRWYQIGDKTCFVQERPNGSDAILVQNIRFKSTDTISRLCSM